MRERVLSPITSWLWWSSVFYCLNDVNAMLWEDLRHCLKCIPLSTTDPKDTCCEWTYSWFHKLNYINFVLMIALHEVALHKYQTIGFKLARIAYFRRFCLFSVLVRILSEVGQKLATSHVSFVKELALWAGSFKGKTGADSHWRQDLHFIFCVN